jgi:hypothetical protein
MNGPIAIALPPEAILAIAEQVATILGERQLPAEDAWLRGAGAIAEYIDSPPSRVYALASARRIPVHRDGSALIARRTELDAWIRDGGGRRP